MWVHDGLVVVSILWSYIYNPNNGLLNSLLGSLGIGPFKFLNDPKTAMLCIVVLSAWQGCGFQMMIFLSGLQDISQFLYEAAEVDGATPFQQFVNITLPGLSNIAVFVSLNIVVSAFQLIIQPMMMTAGGPQNATMTIVYEIYQTGFKYNQMGLSNSYLALILPAIASPMYIFLFRQNFLGIPESIEEAAKLDGASALRIFFQRIMPLAKPIYATVTILVFIALWNDFVWPVMVISDTGKQTIQMALSSLFSISPVNYGNVMAGLTIVTIPVLIIFLSLQKYYVAGVASTGAKN